MDFICVLSKVNTVTINDVTVDIDLSVYEKSSAETMAGKRKQMSTPQTEVAMSLFEDGVNQRGIAEGIIILFSIFVGHFDDSLLAIHCTSMDL
jgi:hypothetical protein